MTASKNITYSIKIEILNYSTNSRREIYDLMNRSIGSGKLELAYKRSEYCYVFNFHPFSADRYTSENYKPADMEYETSEEALNHALNYLRNKKYKASLINLQSLVDESNVSAFNRTIR